MDRGVRIGVDVGGTFTDVVLIVGADVWRAKSPTSPADLVDGVLNGIALVSERAGTVVTELLPQVERFCLGTTSVTNILTEKSGRKVGLLTTRGFEEVIPLAHGTRHGVDGWLTMPPEIVARECIVGVDERIDRSGAIVRELPGEQVVEGARRLTERFGVEAIVVSFLWSFLNPVHELAAAELLATAMPHVPLYRAAALYPIIGEFERTMFSLLNAYSSAAVQGIDRLADELCGLGMEVPVLLMHSAGYAIDVADAREQPLTLAQSGPAAGVSAAVAMIRSLGLNDAVACDMGGTSFDVSLITSGHPTRRDKGTLMGFETALPRIDVESVGAGGGSLCWIDDLGLLRVGPKSAGAVPGPACYARGGDTATVTDALVVLGHMGADGRLGDLTIDRGAAAAVCARLGGELGLRAVETAWAIRKIAQEQMSAAVRAVVVGAGLDPRELTLVAYGGCCGLFAADIARAVGCRHAHVPEVASVLSAMGSAIAESGRERDKSLLLTTPIDAVALREEIDALCAQIDDDLDVKEVPVAARDLRVEVDLRFKRQHSVLSVPLSRHVAAGELDKAVDEFRSEYVRRYGSGALLAGTPIELAAVRVIGTSKHAEALEQQLPAPRPSSATSLPATTWVCVDWQGPASEIPVLAIGDLSEDEPAAGPLQISIGDTQIWVPPGTSARLRPQHILKLEVAP